ncbi:MAG TPA: hypothetical protein ENH74_11780 [Methylophaga sp.]|nr:hypothetical protein [Methylophaga sp.]HEC60540.1 hypothetical protein [Methylophaga sp.]
MKKVMLFIVSMLFAVGANAASLNLTTFENDVSTNAVNNFISTSPSGAASFNTVSAAGVFSLGHTVVSAVDQMVNIEWTFNKQSNLVSGDISKGGDFDLIQAVTGLGYNFNIMLLAGQTYFFDIMGISKGNPLTATLSVSAVPVPAALFLFAPALLGLLGLRRKSASTSVVAA